MKLQLIRHATLWITYAGLQFLLDPMLSEAEVNPPIPNTANERRNPLVPLPAAAAKLPVPDAVLVTHLHPDHWDETAKEKLPKSLPLFCQPGDETAIAASGFSAVSAIETQTTFRGVTISRTSGQHGTGEIGKLMGRVSGFVLQAEGEPALYVAGDTIWCEDVRVALDAYRPDITVVNAGGAQFLSGGHITMNADDVIVTARYAAYTRVVPVHMDAINHCLVTRDELSAKIEAANLSEQIIILEDGEQIEL